MPDMNEIRKTCEAFYNAGFSYDAGPNRGGEYSAVVGDPQLFQSYLQQCSTDLEKIVHYKEKKELTLPHWTAHQAKIAGDYARKYGLTGVVYGPEADTWDGQTVLGIKDNRIVIGINQFAFVHDENLIFVFDHELGHLRDRKLLEQYFPDIGVLMKKHSFTREEGIRILNAFIVLFQRALPNEKKQDLSQRSRELFGDFSSFDNKQLGLLYLIFNEVLRYGEEIHDSRLRRFVFSRDFSHFKNWGFAGDKLSEAINIAELQMAGLWEEFMKQPDFDPTSVTAVGQKDIQFFRLAIQGASALRHAGSNPSETQK